MRDSLLLWTLVFALIGASVVPCPEPAGEAGKRAAGNPVTASPSHHDQRDASSAAHPPDCPQAKTTSVSAPCPCGCDDRAGASATGRLGDALRGWIPAFAKETRGAASVIARSNEPAEPPHPIDHVPRLG